MILGGESLFFIIIKSTWYDARTMSTIHNSDKITKKNKTPPKLNNIKIENIYCEDFEYGGGGEAGD